MNAASMIPLILLSLLVGMKIQKDFPSPPEAITMCQPYAEKCPACKDCSACKHCSVKKGWCSVCFKK